jgi:hypothetical protein
MHNEIWGTADEAELNNVNKKNLLRFAELSPNRMHELIINGFFLLWNNSNKLVFPNVHQGISQIIFRDDSCRGVYTVKSGNIVTGGKFGTVGEPFVLVLERLFMKTSNLCKNHLWMVWF